MKRRGRGNEQGGGMRRKEEGMMRDEEAEGLLRRVLVVSCIVPHLHHLQDPPLVLGSVQ